MSVYRRTLCKLENNINILLPNFAILMSRKTLFLFILTTIPL